MKLKTVVGLSRCRPAWCSTQSPPGYLVFNRPLVKSSKLLSFLEATLFSILFQNSKIVRYIPTQRKYIKFSTACRLFIDICYLFSFKRRQVLLQILYNSNEFVVSFLSLSLSSLHLSFSPFVFMKRSHNRRVCKRRSIWKIEYYFDTIIELTCQSRFSFNSLIW